jgi:hypothetical protein
MALDKSRFGKLKIILRKDLRNIVVDDDDSICVRKNIFEGWNFYFFLFYGKRKKIGKIKFLLPLVYQPKKILLRHII